VAAHAIAITNAIKPPTPAVVQISPAKSEVPNLPKKTEAPPPARTEPQPSAAKPVAAPPPAQTAPVEVVTLPPEPVIRPAPDVLPPRASPPNDVPAAQSPNAPPISNPPPSVAVINARGTESPAGAESSTRRYAYLSPAKPLPGARREAERAFAQAQQAQRSNRLTEARQAYRQATQVDPSYFEAYYNLGLVAFESRNYDESLAAWENALAIQPDSVDARYNFALALKAADYPADAAHQLRQILAANANETRAHLVLGNLCAEQFDDPAQARRHYLKVLELDPRHPQATAIRYWLVGHPP
jgi:Flp pilus assembly protein TadD